MMRSLSDEDWILGVFAIDVYLVAIWKVAPTQNDVLTWVLCTDGFKMRFRRLLRLLLPTIVLAVLR